MSDFIVNNCGCPPEPTVECPIPTGCPVKLPPECIIYSGTLPLCFNLPNPVNLKVVIDRIAELVCQLTSQVACQFTVSAGPDRGLMLPVNSTSLHATSSGQGVSYLWSALVAPGNYLLSSPTTADTLVSELEPGEYVFRITAVNVCSLVETADVVVNVARPDSPLVNPGQNETITLPTNEVLNHFASGSGIGVTFHWEKMTALSSIIVNSGAAITSFTNLEFGVHVFRLTVTDQFGQHAEADFSITVNHPTISVSAGPDRIITQPSSSTTLSGSGSGVGLVFSWMRLSGNTDGSLLFSGSAITGVINKFILGRTVYRLTATDAYGQSVFEDVNVDVVAAVNCVKVEAGPDQNIPFTNVTVTLAGIVTKGDGTVTSKIWSFVSGPVTAVITTNSLLNSTVTGLSAVGKYTLRLTANDSNGCVAEDTVDINVTDTPCCDPSGVSATAQVVPVSPSFRLLGFSSNTSGKFTVQSDACTSAGLSSFPLAPPLYMSPEGLNSNGELVLSSAVYTDSGLTTPFVETPAFSGYRVLLNESSGSKIVIGWSGNSFGSIATRDIC